MRGHVPFFIEWHFIFIAPACPRVGQRSEFLAHLPAQKKSDQQLISIKINLADECVNVSIKSGRCAPTGSPNRLTCASLARSHPTT